MRLTIPVEIEAPDDATHYLGNLNDMSFYKKKDIGVAGERWFRWSIIKKAWLMVSHHHPHWSIKSIPEEWKK